MEKQHLPKIPFRNPELKMNNEKEVMEVLPKEKKSLLKKVLPFIVGFISFMIGIILFFPLEDIAKNTLNNFSIRGEPIQYEELSLSILGDFSIDGISMDLSFLNSGIPNRKNNIKIATLQGDFSFLQFILNRELDAKIILEGVELNFQLNEESGYLRGGTWQVSLKGNQLVDENQREINMNFSLIDIMSNHEAEIPLVGQKLGSFIIDSILGKMDLKKGKLNIKNFQVNSDIAKAKVNGSMDFRRQLNTDLRIDIDPTFFIERYKEFNIDLVLQNLNILQENGNISLECKKNFDCEPVQKTY